MNWWWIWWIAILSGVELESFRLPFGFAKPSLEVEHRLFNHDIRITYQIRCSICHSVVVLYNHSVFRKFHQRTGENHMPMKSPVLINGAPWFHPVTFFLSTYRFWGCLSLLRLCNKLLQLFLEISRRLFRNTMMMWSSFLRWERRSRRFVLVLQLRDMIAWFGLVGT